MQKTEGKDTGTSRLQGEAILETQGEDVVLGEDFAPKDTSENGQIRLRASLRGECVQSFLSLCISL